MKSELKPVVILRVPHLLKSLRQSFGVTVLATRRDLRTPCRGVPSSVSPLNWGLVAQSCLNHGPVVRFLTDEVGLLSLLLLRKMHNVSLLKPLFGARRDLCYFDQLIASHLLNHCAIVFFNVGRIPCLFHYALEGSCLTFEFGK